MAGTNIHDVLIIGAGVQGCSLAYYLSLENVDVGIIERCYPAAGTTGATVAAISAATRERISYARFVEQSKDLYCALVEDLAVDIHYERCGMLWILMTEVALTEGNRVMQQNSAAGLDIRPVDRTEIRELEPALSTECILGAGLAGTDGQVDPFLLLQGLAGRATERGARFYYHTEVEHLSVGGGCVTVHSSDGLFQAERLIVAAGVWSPLITQSLGIGLPLRPVRGQVLVTQPMPKMFNAVIHPGISQDWRGNLVLGVCSEEVGYDNRNTLPALQMIARQNLLKAPLLAELLVIRSYSGLRPMPFDGYPLIDTLPGYDNIFVAAAHSGIANSQIIAKSLTEWILEGRPGTDLTDYALTRSSLSKPPVPYRAI